VQQLRDVLSDLAHHHFRDAHGFRVGDAHALHELRLNTKLTAHVRNFASAAVHHNRMNAHIMQQRHIAHHGGFEVFFGHGRAAVFDDDRLAVPATQIRQRLRNNLGALQSVNCVL
jgi:hypothetical protein